MPSFDVLRAYLVERASFTEEELEFLRERFVPVTLEAGEFLQRAGEVATHAAFVATGCLRSYIVDDKGKEHIVQFAPETWWLADAASLMSGAPSQYFVDAVERSEILLINPQSHQEVIQHVPGYGASMRAGLQRHNAAKDKRIATSLSASAEERYLEFMKTYPSIAQRGRRVETTVAAAGAAAIDLDQEVQRQAWTRVTWVGAGCTGWDRCRWRSRRTCPLPS